MGPRGTLSKGEQILPCAWLMFSLLGICANQQNNPIVGLGVGGPQGLWVVLNAIHRHTDAGQDMDALGLPRGLWVVYPRSARHSRVERGY